MEPASNKHEEPISDELSKLVSIRDELREAKAKQDAILDACLKSEMKLDVLLSPVVTVHQQMLEKIDRMDEDMKVLETIENMGNEWYPATVDMKKNIIRLQEDELSKRINQLNDDKNKLSDLENDVIEEEKEELDLEALIEVTKAEIKKQRAIREELSSSTLSKEISEREAECRHLENEYWNFEEKVKSKNLELQALFDKKNITSQNVIAQEAKYRNQLAIFDQTANALNDYKAKYERMVEKNQRIVLQVEAIEKEREEDMDKLNLIINQSNDVYVKFKSDCDEITNKMISEFGDVESFPQMILKERAKLAKLNIDCQTIYSTFNAECQKETEIEQRESTLLAKKAELEEKRDKKFEQLNVGAAQNRNENGPIASSSVALNQNNVAELMHPNTNVRKLNESRSQPPRQISYADDRVFRNWKALRLTRENNN